MTQCLLQLILLTLCGAMTFAETAAVSVSDPRLEKLAAEGGKRGARLRKILSSPARFLASMKTAFLFTALTAAAFGVYGFAGRIASALDGTGLSAGNCGALGTFIVALAECFLILVFCELIPRRIAARSPEKAALRMSAFLRIVMIASEPAVWLTGALSGGILRLMGIDPNAEEEIVTEEEILMMSDAGAEKGTIDEDENRIIKNVFAFDDMTAGQVCTHRTEVSVLWEKDDISEWEETIHRTRHSIFPVCGESVDDVIGVLSAKDYFRLDDRSRENIMRNAVREPYFVHETMKADRLFEQMKQSGADHFAVVVDEYGGMSGIITVTDLVEQLVGDFSDDEDDIPQPRMEKLTDNSWLIPGATSIAEVSEELGIELPAERYETFGGYVIAELGDIPRDGTQLSIEADGLKIEVLELRHHRIEVCRVERVMPQEASDKE